MTSSVIEFRPAIKMHMGITTAPYTSLANLTLCFGITVATTQAVMLQQLDKQLVFIQKFNPFNSEGEKEREKVSCDRLCLLVY